MMHWLSYSFYKSKCPHLCVSICLFVSLSYFLTQFNRLFSPLPKGQCPNCLDFRNPCGKVMERSGLRFDHFCSFSVQNCGSKKSFLDIFFICTLCLNLFLSPVPKIQCSNLCRIFGILGGKVMERNGLRF